MSARPEPTAVSINEAEEIELRVSVARIIADRLAIELPEEVPIFRLQCAHDAAKKIVFQAKCAGGIEELRYNLSRLEASNYEI